MIFKYINVVLIFSVPFTAQKTMLKQRDHPHPDADFQLWVGGGRFFFYTQIRLKFPKISGTDHLVSQAFW